MGALIYRQGQQGRAEGMAAQGHDDEGRKGGRESGRKEKGGEGKGKGLQCGTRPKHKNHGVREETKKAKLRR